MDGVQRARMLLGDDLDAAVGAPEASGLHELTNRVPSSLTWAQGQNLPGFFPLRVVDRQGQLQRSAALVCESEVIIRRVVGQPPDAFPAQALKGVIGCYRVEMHRDGMAHVLKHERGIERA